MVGGAGVPLLAVRQGQNLDTSLLKVCGHHTAARSCRETQDRGLVMGASSDITSSTLEARLHHLHVGRPKLLVGSAGVSLQSQHLDL